jgi:hypothetical protein
MAALSGKLGKLLPSTSAVFVCDIQDKVRASAQRGAGTRDWVMMSCRSLARLLQAFSPL